MPKFGRSTIEQWYCMPKKIVEIWASKMRLKRFSQFQIFDSKVIHKLSTLTKY